MHVYDSAVPLLDLYTTELCAYTHQKTWTKMFMAQVIVIVQTRIFQLPINSRMGKQVSGTVTQWTLNTGQKDKNYHYMYYNV